jgi:hypothetical protein
VSEERVKPASLRQSNWDMPGLLLGDLINLTSYRKVEREIKPIKELPLQSKRNVSNKTNPLDFC